MAEPKTKPNAGGETVTLLLPHVHAGQPYKAGDKITVTASQVVWLRKRGVVGTANPEPNLPPGDK